MEQSQDTPSTPPRAPRTQNGLCFDNKRKWEGGETHEYTEEIAKYHKEREQESFIPVTSLRFSRGRLYNWLVAQQKIHTFSDATLHRTLAICDRYLSAVKVSNDEIQLVAISSLMVASKYHEIWPTLIDGVYTRQEMVQMELAICRHFKMNFSWPTSFDFLERYIDVALAATVFPPKKEQKLKIRLRHLAQCALERMMLCHEPLAFKPSILASVVLFTAMRLLGLSWNPTLCEATGHSTADLHTGEYSQLSALTKAVICCPKMKHHDAVIEKYSAPERGAVASLRVRPSVGGRRKRTVPRGGTTPRRARKKTASQNK